MVVNKKKAELKGVILSNVEELSLKTPAEFEYDGEDGNDIESPNDLSGSLLQLWENFIKIYGKEVLSDVSNFWNTLKKFFSFNQSCLINPGEDGDDEPLNIQVPIDCISGFKSFATELLRVDSEGEFFERIEDTLLKETVKTGYKYIVPDYDSTLSLRELCFDVFNRDYQKNPNRAIGFIISIACELSNAFSTLSEHQDVSNLSAITLTIRDIVKMKYDFPSHSLNHILNCFSAREFEACVDRLKEFDDEDEFEEEDEETEATKGKDKKPDSEDKVDDNDEENKNSDGEESIDESFDKEDESAGDKEYLWDLLLDFCDIWGSLFEKLDSAFTSQPIMYVIRKVAPEWLKKEHYKEKCIGYYGIFAILDHLQPKDIPSEFWSLSQVLFENSTSDHQGIKHNCAFGLGLIAQKAPHVFEQVGEKILKRLMEMAEFKQKDTIGMKIYKRYLDNVYSAIGKVLANNIKFITDEAIELWLSNLPLQSDREESVIMFSEFCKIFDDKEHMKALRGKKGQFHDLIVKKFDEMSESKFCDRETISKLSLAKTKFISQYQ